MTVDTSWIDMRSDTVTKPTPGMREYMMSAEVGDDVFGDDPTVNRLQTEVADLLGKEAALYVPSGTMSNQLALKAQTQPGDQVVVEDGSHIYRYEGGAPAALSGVLLTCIQTGNGMMAWPEIASALNPDNVHCAPASLVCLENTHNRGGGRILDQAEVVRIGDKAHACGLRVHLDGARLWHAHVATGTPLSLLAAPADSVSVCFSKGLGAPVGSILAADRPTIQRARRYRKMFGGGMRQVGLLAAGCLYALAHHLERLPDDHTHAQLLAAGVDHPDLALAHPVETNIVIFNVAVLGGDIALLEYLKSQRILAVGFGPGRVRFVPNLANSRQDVEAVVAALQSWPGVRH